MSVATRLDWYAAKQAPDIVQLEKRQVQEQTCKAKVSVASRPTVSQTTPGSSAAASLVEGAGSSNRASAVLPPYFTTIFPFAGNGLLTSGSTAYIFHRVIPTRRNMVG